MAARSHRRSKGTKIECIAATEERAQVFDQLAAEQIRRLREVERYAVGIRDRPNSEVEHELKVQFEYVQRIMSKMDINDFVSKEICTMWQNTFAKNVLVPCSQDTIVVSSAAASHSECIRKQEELGEKLKESSDQCARQETVIAELTETRNDFQARSHVHDELCTKLQAKLDRTEMNFDRQLEDRTSEIEALKDAKSRYVKVLESERTRSEIVRKQNEKLAEEGRSKSDDLARFADDLHLEQACHASLRTTYLNLQEITSEQEEKMAALREENTERKRKILDLEEQVHRSKIKHGTIQRLADGVRHLRALNDKQEIELAAKNTAMTEIRSSFEELKGTVYEHGDALITLGEEFDQLISENIRLLETGTQQNRLVQSLQSQLGVLAKEAVREKHASAKVLKDALSDCQKIADSETNDTLSRAESEYRVAKSQMREGHRRSQQHLRNTIHCLEKEILKKETMINVFVDVMEQNRVLHNQKEQAEIEIRKQLESQTKSQRTFEASTEAEKRSMRDEIATLKHQLQEQADNHRSRTQRLEDDLEAARGETEDLKVELERSNNVSAMHIRILEDMYGDGLCEKALAQFDVRTRRLEAELPGPSELRVDFQNSRFLGYSSNRNLTAEEVARKVLRFVWLLEKESAQRCASQYTDIVDIWRIWEDPRSMGLNQKADIFYILFDFSIHVIKTARAKEVWPFLQWLALELLNALVRYGATERHLKQVNDQILGAELGPQAQIVSMGYAHLQAAVKLEMTGSGRDNSSLLLLTLSQSYQSGTHLLVCAAASSTVEWHVIYMELEGSVYMVSQAVEAGNPVVLHQGDVGRYAFFRVRGETWLSINGGEDFWKVIRHKEQFLSWMLSRMTDKPSGFEEWRRNAISSS